VEDAKVRIGDSVRQIDELNREIQEHWSKVQRLVGAGSLDEAISILNAYFRLKSKLDQVESHLQGVLKGAFSDR
jgi:hypothetical protein